MKKRWDENPHGKSKVGHPVMMVEGEGKAEKRCYGCGQPGHMRGAEECKASKDAIWGGAPKAYLEKVQRRFGKTPTGEKRPFAADAKQPCPYWSSGDSYCRFAERCHFSHDGSQGGSQRARVFVKGKGNGKGKGRGKGKGKGKGKRKGGRGRTPGSATMIVEKKSVHYVDEKEKNESSMMVSQKVAEDKIYNLTRGHTSLMIAQGSDSSEDDEGEGSSEDEGEEGSEDDENEGSSEAVPEEKPIAHMTSSASRDPKWPALPTSAPTWGNNPMPDIRDEEWANEWRESGRRSKRRARDQEISRGGSPPQTG
jgi:hypothetical protein